MAKGTKRTNHRKAEDMLARTAMQHHDFIGQAEPERQQAKAQKEERVQRDHAKLEKEVVREMAREVEQMSVAEERPRATERVEGNRVEGNRVEGNRVEGNRVEGNRVEGNRAEANRVEGNRAEANRVDRTRVEGSRVAANGIEGRHVEGNHTPAANREASNVFRLREGAATLVDTLREGPAGIPKAMELLRSKAEERLAQLPPPLKALLHLGEQTASLVLWPARIALRLAGELLSTPKALLEILRDEKAEHKA